MQSTSIYGEALAYSGTGHNVLQTCLINTDVIKKQHWLHCSLLVDSLDSYNWYGTLAAKTILIFLEELLS